MKKISAESAICVLTHPFGKVKKDPTMSDEPASYDLTLRRNVAGSDINGSDKTVTVQKGWTGSELTAEAESQYKLSLWSIELRLGSSKGPLISGTTKIWTAINGKTDSVIYCCTS